MQDLRREARALSRVRAQLGDWFPRVYGERIRADVHGARYAVFWRTGNGNWSCLYRGEDRRRALTAFRKFPKGAAYVEMRCALTGELIGEQGRNDFDSEISELIEAAQLCSDDETATVVCATRGGARRRQVNKRQLLMQRAAVLYAACHLPGGDV